MWLDKVRCVAIGGMISMPALLFYIWSTITQALQDSEVTRLLITVAIGTGLGVVMGFFVNPMISYKRNPNICVGGIPFPITYGMPVEEGCVGGWVVLRNFWFDIVYWILAFIALVFVIYYLAVEYHFSGVLFFIVATNFGVKIFLMNVLKIYPIKIVAEDQE